MIENCIEQYLLQYHFCPLPEVGTLQVSKKNATLLRSENVMSAPVVNIDFTSESRPSDAFIGFIAKLTHVDLHQAASSLRDYCHRLLALKQGDEQILSNTGKFLVNAQGELQFDSFKLPSVLLPAAPAVRVIHPNSVHQVRVGDNEHSSTYMTEMLNDNKKSNGLKWLIAAACIALVAIAMIAFQMFFQQGGAGNVMPLDTTTAPASYQLVQ